MVGVTDEGECSFRMRQTLVDRLGDEVTYNESDVREWQGVESASTVNQYTMLPVCSMLPVLHNILGRHGLMIPAKVRLYEVRGTRRSSVWRSGGRRRGDLGPNCMCAIGQSISRI